MALRTMRTLSASESPGRAMWKPPSPTTVTLSPVRPSRRRAMPETAAIPSPPPQPTAGATVAASARRRKSRRVMAPTPSRSMRTELSGGGPAQGAPAPSEVQCEDLAPRLRVRQVHEEELVEPAAAEQLGRQPRHVVRRRDDEHRPLPLLQPCRKSPEQAGGARVGAVAGARSGEPLLDLVHPEGDR